MTIDHDIWLMIWPRTSFFPLTRSFFEGLQSLHESRGIFRSGICGERDLNMRTGLCMQSLRETLNGYSNKKII